MYTLADLLAFVIYMCVVGSIISGFAVATHFKDKK